MNKSSSFEYFHWRRVYYVFYGCYIYFPTMYHFPMGAPLPPEFFTHSAPASGSTPRAEVLAQDFCDEFQGRCRRLFTALKVPETTIEGIVETELTFARRIIGKCAEWNVRGATVLWDIDETIGVTQELCRDIDFVFRPCFPSLMPFLNAHFPNLTHGICSAWNSRFIPVAFGSQGHVKIARNFFDPNSFYSARYKFFASEHSAAADIEEAKVEYNVKDKVVTFREICGKNPGRTFYIIDNLQLEPFLAGQSVFVGDCEPIDSLRPMRGAEIETYRFKAHGKLQGPWTYECIATDPELVNPMLVSLLYRPLPSRLRKLARWIIGEF